MEESWCQLNRRTELKHELKRIEAELRFWDPIGVLRGPRRLDESAPPGEYDRYAPDILRMLQRGASVGGVELHLGRIRTGLMELDSDPSRDRETAERLVEWWLSRSEK